MEDTLLIAHADGSTTIVGAPESKKVESVAAFVPGRVAPNDLPRHVNLAKRLTPIKDQGDTMSCVAHASAGAYEYLVKRHLGHDFDVSRMFIYYNARKRDGDQGSDAGTVIESAIKSLIEFGSCAEALWPFEPARVNDEPPPSAYEQAKSFRAEYTEQVPTELDAWRHSLAEGHPIIFMLRLYRSFHDTRGGKVTMPLEREIARGRRYNHAMLCVGYNDEDRVFLVRNSWGNSWGHNGYGYVPYDYVISADYNVNDSWIIRRITDIDEIDRSTWSDEKSMLPRLETELAAMTEEAYRALLSALGEVPLASRLAVLYLAAAQADGELGEKELAALAAELDQLTAVLGHIGTAYDPQAVLATAQRSVEDRALVEESMAILGAHLSLRMRVAILRSIRRISGADTLSAAEQSFVETLINRWQIEESEEDGTNPAEETPGQ